jgi:Mg-chelatase subunit ChlI
MLCEQCLTRKGRRRQAPEVRKVPVPVVDLPLGATEDRVIGALDLESALTRGEKAFEPGLLARAHRGFLYIDEVNLLEDHLVDLLLDVAASGENVVEREGLSRPPPGALRARRQRQPRGGRAAARSCSTASACRWRSPRPTRAVAAFEGLDAVTDAQLRIVAPLALRHRLRRDVLDEIGSSARVDKAVEEVFGG